MNEYINPIEGAAEYIVEPTGIDTWAVYMYPHGEKTGSCIDTKKSWLAARKCANSWQKKENKAVTKANKSSQGAI